MNSQHKTSAKNNKNDSKSFLVLLLFIFGAGFFYWLGISNQSTPPKPAKKSVSAYSTETEALVNRHLHMTSQAVQLNERKRKIENSFSAPQLGESVVNRPRDKKDYGVDHSSDTNESNAYDDLNRYPKEMAYTNPDNIIRGQLSDQDTAIEYDEAYRQEYARQFVENARRNGYEVKLNSEYVVISVRKVRIPSSSNLYQQPQ